MTTDVPAVRMRTADRRRQILDEATRIVGQRGYYGFSVQELADSCGLTVAGVLHHVGTKEKLLMMLLDERDRRDAEAIIDRVEGDLDELTDSLTLGRVLRVLHEIVVRNSEQPELVRLFTVLRSEALYREHPAYDYFRARDLHVVESFTRMITHLDTVGEPRATARQLLALMAGLKEQWLRFPDEFDLVTEWDRAAIKLLATDSDANTSR